VCLYVCVLCAREGEGAHGVRAHMSTRGGSKRSVSE
jgi:hypothetical protein